MLRDAAHFLLAILVAVLLAAASRIPADLEELNDLPSDTDVIQARWLSEDLIPELARFTRLRMLDFESGQGARDSQITDAGLSQLARLDLPHLQILDLGYCDHFTSTGLQHVAQIDSLIHLGLAACRGVTDEGLSHIAKMDRLEALDLRGCDGISDAGLEELVGMRSLRALLLGGCTNISLEAVDELRRRMPNCKVDKDDQRWATQVSMNAQALSPRTVPLGMRVVVALIGLLGMLYIPLQAFALWRMKGYRRIIALVPLAPMVVVIGYSIAALLQESNRPASHIPGIARTSRGCYIRT